MNALRFTKAMAAAYIAPVARRVGRTSDGGSEGGLKLTQEH
jgi:hypothetical protein